jgi:hypothetical protein
VHVSIEVGEMNIFRSDLTNGVVEADLRLNKDRNPSEDENHTGNLIVSV